MSNVLIIEWGKNRPICSAIINMYNKKIIKIPLWSSGKSIKEALRSEELLKKTASSLQELLIVNYKDFIKYFGACDSQKLYDFPLEYNNIRQAVKKIFKFKDELFKEWQEIRANAAEIYQELEDNGVYNGYKLEYPRYDMNVYSGRSRTKGFNIQGYGSDYDIRHFNSKLNIFVRFDWIAADARIGAFLSNDDEFNKSFDSSDPYTYMEECLDGEISRDECKPLFNRAVNSLEEDSIINNLFPNFAKWIDEMVEKLKKVGYSESILGRKFYSDGTLKGNRRAFNAILQGSVAHAMNIVIFEVRKKCGNIIIAEQHDSLTVCTNRERFKSDINKISNIMYNPFYNISLNMPLKIEIGKSWAKYKYLKDYRLEE